MIATASKPIRKRRQTRARRPRRTGSVHTEPFIYADFSPRVQVGPNLYAGRSTVGRSMHANGVSDGSIQAARLRRKTDEIARYSIGAKASCDEDTGKYTWKWVAKLNERAVKCGVKDCIAVHEEEHVKINSSCCARYSKCFNAATNAAEFDACVDVYLNWYNDPAQNAWDELAAYTAQASCLNKKIKEHESNGDPDCCVLDMIESATNAEGRAKKYGQKAQAKPCPFAEDGSIAGGRQ